MTCRSKYCYFKVRDLVPESQAYMDLLAFERKLDATIMRKRLDIQEALKRPMKVGGCWCLWRRENWSTQRKRSQGKEENLPQT